MSGRLVIDLARESDIPALNDHIAASASVLCARFYQPDCVAAAIKHVFGVDSQLVQAGCYFVARVRGEIVGCGGWSPFVTLFGADQAAGRDDRQLDPMRDAARIRAFFVAPDWTRAGIGSALLEHCEMEALEAGFTRVTLMATLSGMNFYLSQGYEAQDDYVAKLGGASIRFVPMHKSLLAAGRTPHPIEQSLAAR